MSWSFRISLALSFSLSAFPPVLAESKSNNQGESSLRITVRVYNFAQVSTGTLTEAEREATSIFRQVGLDTQWLDCPLLMADFPDYPTCQQPSGLSDFVLRILPEAMAKRQTFRDTTFGFALPCPENERGCVANVFYHRIEDLARRGQIRQPEVMGHAIAHEIGHLLLGLNAHSAAGIMRADWTRRDLQQALLGHLIFAAGEAELIRAEVLRRAQQQEALQLSGGLSPK
jgi:hypothetical protein